MKAVLVGNDGALVLADAPEPDLGPDRVMIAVHATAVNRADLLQRRGLYPPPPGESPILGLEAAGVIVAKGEGVERWSVGDRVCCLLGGGGYAERVAVHEDMLLPIPEGLDFLEAAAIPEVFYTAFLNLSLEAGMRADDDVLIHAGGSGVGTAGIQWARAVGARVLVTAGSDDKLRRCVELGAHAGINYKSEDFGERALALTDGAGVDVVLDCVGGQYLGKNLAVLKTKGRLVVIGLMGGTHAELDLALVVRKGLRVIGSVLRSRPLPEKIAITRVFKADVLPLFAQRRIRPIIDSTFALADAARAHDRVAANENFGKVMLRVVG